jgi:hypothetical protein
MNELLLENDFFNDEINISGVNVNSDVDVHKKRSKSYRTADLILNKIDILNNLSYTDDMYSMPLIKPVGDIELPKDVIAFSKAVSSHEYSQIVHFYESDQAFARILHDPKRYGNILKRFSVVISPDFSQKIGYPRFVCIQNNWWNKAIGAYLQSIGIVVIPNVAWSTPDSYPYAFSGVPKKSIIAINSTGVVSNPASIYLWRKGYEAAIKELDPLCVIRYGSRMPGEDDSISVYYENTNLKNLRNGGKRIIC